MATFQMLTDEMQAELISNSSQRVVYVAPGIWLPVAKAVSVYQKRNMEASLEIILDPDPQVYRLGYGELGAIKHLDDEGIYLRKCLGIRVGLLIADKKAWFFTPTPRLVEEESTSNSSFAPNSISINLNQADQLLSAIAPHLVLGEMLELNAVANKPPVICVRKPEIADQTFNLEDMQNLEADLIKCPPQKFDLARQVNVYSSYIQFVELSLEGTHLTRHTISIPQKLLNLASNENDKDRLKASYQLIKSDSELSGKAMHEKVKALRDKYLKSLGNRYGTVILKQHKNDFSQELMILRKELSCFKQFVQSKLEEEFEECKKNLKGILKPAIEKNPPDELKYGISTSTLDKSAVDKYLDKKIQGIIPKTEDFVKDMDIHCQFKEVTYETLHEENFIACLSKAFPYEDLPVIPIKECKAAPVK